VRQVSYSSFVIDFSFGLFSSTGRASKGRGSSGASPIGRRTVAEQTSPLPYMIAAPHSIFGNNSHCAGKQHHHENETILRDLSCQALATFCAPKPSVKRETPQKIEWMP
jgi:hypothetical protein